MSGIFMYLRRRGGQQRARIPLGVIRAEVPGGSAVNEQVRRVLDAKRAERDRLAALPFARKLEILEQLRSRSLELGRNPLRNGAIR